VYDTPLRLRRILHPDTGRALLVTFTSSMEVGVTAGMADLAGTIGRLAESGYPTAVVVHAGVEKSLFARFPNLPCGTVVDLFGGTWMTTAPQRREQICTLEHAVRVGADSVLMTVALGSADEASQLHHCGQIARECRAWGMPLVVRVDTTETDARRQFSATMSGHGARLAYELGADIVIVNYSGDPATFGEALQGVDIPVLFGGAPNMATDEALLTSIEESMSAGAAGIALSASMFWNDGPTRALEQAAEVVSRGAAA
jgi:fructose-bisphosphate aldolase / 2-amino-3,7-dideoxy-D-threo-hept-6-ulosonate synthase